MVDQDTEDGARDRMEWLARSEPRGDADRRRGEQSAEKAEVYGVKKHPDGGLGYEGSLGRWSLIWVTSSGFDNVRLGQVSLTQQTYRRISLGPLGALKLTMVDANDLPV